MHPVSVFLSAESLGLFHEAHIEGQNPDQFIFSQVREMAKQTRLIFCEQKFQIFDHTGKPTEATLESLPVPLPSNQVWQPKENLRPYSIKVGDKTWDLLTKTSQIFQLRVTHFNKAAPTPMPMPSCIEELIHSTLFGPTMQLVAKEIDRELDEDFKKVNQKEPLKDTKPA